MARDRGSVAARVLQAPGDHGVDALSFSPDGSLLACGVMSSDVTSAHLVRVWNPETGALARTLEVTGPATPQSEKQEKRNSLSTGPDGLTAASAGGQGTFIFNLNNGKSSVL